MYLQFHNNNDDNDDNDNVSCFLSSFPLYSFSGRISQRASSAALEEAMKKVEFLVGHSKRRKGVSWISMSRDVLVIRADGCEEKNDQD